MQTTPSIPHWLSDLWLPAVSLIFGGSGLVAWTKIWLDRRRPSEITAANQRAEAEARKLDADASTTVAKVLISFSANLEKLTGELEDQRERHSMEIEIARTRTHSAMNEINRCIAFIKHHEILMTENKIEFMPFIVKSYKDIVGEE